MISRLLWRWALPWVDRVTPTALPALTRPTYRREVLATAFFMMAMATIEGGVIAVFAKQTFADSVPSFQLNLMVGLLGAAAELANILSFAWSNASHGQRKVPMLTGLMAVVVACIGAIALVPTTGPGALWTLLALVLVARVCWSGVITLRPTLWRANYPRHARVNVVGVLSAISVLTVATVGASLAWLLDRNPDAYRVFLPIAAVCALIGTLIYSRMRVRGEAVLLREERADKSNPSSRAMRPWQGPLVVWQVLRQDRWYAQFMLWMFVLGFANLTITPTLVISLKEEFGYGHFQSVLITSSIPAMATLVGIPLWRRLLDRAHIVRFRAIHGWTFVAAGIFYTTGAAIDVVTFYFIGAVLMGIGFGGGSLAWNLGHVDFSPPSQTSKYMATHVTLNGIRGLMAPVAVVAFYETMKARGFDAHLWVQASSLVISVVGAAGFVHLRASMGKLADHHARA